MSYRSVFKPDLFAGQNIIVTGGGSGIGRCTAHELASLGARVVLVGRKQDKLDAVAAEIEEDGGQAIGFACDIRDEEVVKATVAEIYKAVEVVHGLVNNAGGQFPSPLALINQKGWETVVRTNLTGGFLMAREVFTQGMNRNGGAIVNITSIAGHKIHPFAGSAYSISKTALSGLTREMANEFSSLGVRVNAVAPGEIETEMVGPEYEMLIPRIPLERMGTPEDVAGTVFYLCSGDSVYVTGTEIWVTGGQHLF